MSDFTAKWNAIKAEKFINSINASDLTAIEHLLHLGENPNMTSVPVVFGIGKEERIV